MCALTNSNRLHVLHSCGCTYICAKNKNNKQTYKPEICSHTYREARDLWFYGDFKTTTPSGHKQETNTANETQLFMKNAQQHKVPKEMTRSVEWLYLCVLSPPRHVQISKQSSCQHTRTEMWCCDSNSRKLTVTMTNL